MSVNLIGKDGNLTRVAGKGVGGDGTGDYTELENKPRINGVTLNGDVDPSDLDLVSAEDELTTEQVNMLLAYL